MANVAWRGAVEFAGFPVNVALYSRVKKQRNESFKTIAPSGAPMQQGDPVDSSTGKSYPKDQSRKGVPIGKDEYHVLPEKVVAQITEGQKTKVVKLAQFAPRETIALDLAFDRYKVLPDDKVAGSEQSTGILWNSLRASGLAYVAQVTFQSSGMDGLLVLYADDNGFWAAMLPFEEELYDVPIHDFEVNEKAAQLFATIVEQQHEVGPFDHSAFASEYKARRKRLIEAALAGEDLPADDTPPADVAVPDLMALLERQVEEAKVAA